MTTTTARWIPAPKLPPLYPKQRRAILCESRYTVIEATTKAGKTAGCLVWILREAWNKGRDNRSWWWVAPIITQAKIAYRRLKRMLRQFDPSRVTWEANETDLRITLRNGAMIWFKGSDKPDTLYGEDVYGAVIDEASRCKEEAWYAVRSTLTATRAPVKIIGNVRGRKNWAYTMARKAEAGARDMSYFRLTALDAVAGGIMADAEVEDARRNLPDHVFRELYLAEASDDGSNPFGLTAIRKCIAPLSTNPPVAFGIDLAKKRDWTVPIGLDDAGTVCRIDRWQSDWGQTTRRLIDLVGTTPALVDSTGVGDAILESLQRGGMAAEGYVFTGSPRGKQQLMESLASAIQREEIHFPEGWLTAELEAFEYVYRPGGGVSYSAPEGMTDDGVCALALTWKKKASAFGINLFGGGVTTTGAA